MMDYDVRIEIEEVGYTGMGPVYDVYGYKGNPDVRYRIAHRVSNPEKHMEDEYKCSQAIRLGVYRVVSPVLQYVLTTAKASSVPPPKAA